MIVSGLLVPVVIVSVLLAGCSGSRRPFCTYAVILWGAVTVPTVETITITCDPNLSKGVDLNGSR